MNIKKTVFSGILTSFLLTGCNKNGDDVINTYLETTKFDVCKIIDSGYNLKELCKEDKFNLDEILSFEVDKINIIELIQMYDKLRDLSLFYNTYLDKINGNVLSFDEYKNDLSFIYKIPFSEDNSIEKYSEKIKLTSEKLNINLNLEKINTKLAEINKRLDLESKNILKYFNENDAFEIIEKYFETGDNLRVISYLFNNDIINNELKTFYNKNNLYLLNSFNRNNDTEFTFVLKNIINSENSLSPELISKFENYILDKYNSIVVDDNFNNYLNFRHELIINFKNINKESILNNIFEKLLDKTKTYGTKSEIETNKEIINFSYENKNWSRGFNTDFNVGTYIGTQNLELKSHLILTINKVLEEINNSIYSHEKFVKIVNLDSITNLIAKFFEKYSEDELKNNPNFIELLEKYLVFLNRNEVINTLKNSDIQSYRINREDILFNIFKILNSSKNILDNSSSIDTFYEKVN